MNRKLPNFKLPTWASSPSLQEIAFWRREITKVLQDALGRLVEQVNSQVQGVGETLTTGNLNYVVNSITVSNPIHKVEGTGTIQYIYTTVDKVGTSNFTTASNGSSFTGPIFLIPTEAWVTANNGTGTWRIASPNTTMTPNKLAVFVFDGDAWYGSN